MSFHHVIRFCLPVATLSLICTLLAGCAAPGGQSRSNAQSNIPWDWSGVIGTGQSLSVGARALPVISTNQPGGNLKLSTDHLPWPIDPNDPSLALVPLVEPIGRLAHHYPSSWPENIDGETPHTAMANELTALVRTQLGRDYVSIHSAVGEDGQGMVFLKKNAVPKGLNGRSYAAALIETKAITRLAHAAGKTYGVSAIIVTHGEADAGNPNYETQLRQLWQDYNTDLPAITGQTQKIPMIVSQQNSCSDHSASTLAEWQAGVDYPGDLICSGPKYQYPYFKDGIHLTATGYAMLGEKYAQICFQNIILGGHWQPLEPVAIEHSGTTITVRFHVPAPPLAWDTTCSTAHADIPEWSQGRGFEITSATGDRITIISAEITGDSIKLTCATDPGAGARVGYAMIASHDKMTAPQAGTTRWGQLRDSDPFTGSTTRQPQPNYCVAFELKAP